jgi:hypothetical protein
MGESERQNHASPTVLESSSRTPLVSSTDVPPPARVTLPANLPGSLRYLDDAQLQMLLEAVTLEINRRNQAAPKNETATLVATIGTSSQGQSVTGRNNKARGIDEIPEGKANLIRASFMAGVKPTAIGRTFRISQSLVNRVLSSSEKPKR